MDKKINNFLLIASLVSFLLVAVSLTAMAFGGSATSSEISIVSIICGICFWSFLIIGIIFQIVLSKKINKWKSKYYRIRRSMRISPKIGIISLFKTPFGIVSDILFLLSLITFVVAYCLTDGISIICYLSLSIIFFSFCSHCIFNGKNYYYIINRQTIEEKYKKMMEESQ